MKKLSVNDKEVFLKNGVLTQPFLDDDFVKGEVEIDFNAKILHFPNYTKIESLYHWINHVIKFSKDKEFIEKHKFQRTAKEIWESGFAVGCSDYAILFATFARQLGFSTAILATAEFSWLERFKKKERNSNHSGHYFCECFYEGNWVLVDPANENLMENYSLNIIKLPYTLNSSNKFVPYLRCVDLEKKQNIKQHNEEMDKLCESLNL